MRTSLLILCGIHVGVCGLKRKLWEEEKSVLSQKDAFNFSTLSWPLHVIFGEHLELGVCFCMHVYDNIQRGGLIGLFISNYI